MARGVVTVFCIKIQNGQRAIWLNLKINSQFYYFWLQFLKAIALLYHKFACNFWLIDWLIFIVVVKKQLFWPALSDPNLQIWQNLKIFEILFLFSCRSAKHIDFFSFLSHLLSLSLSSHTQWITLLSTDEWLCLSSVTIECFGNLFLVKKADGIQKRLMMSLRSP